MPAANKATTEANSRDLFPGALEMMILESLRREPAHGYALVQYIQHGPAATIAEGEAGEGRVELSWSNRRMRTHQITAAGLRRLEQ